VRNSLIANKLFGSQVRLLRIPRSFFPGKAVFARAILAVASVGLLHAAPVRAAADSHLYTLATDQSQGTNVTTLVNGGDGAIYGTTETGAYNSTNPSLIGGGNIFRLAADGTFVIIHSLDDFSWSDEVNTDGIFPYGLMLGPDSALYGFAEAGGPNGTGTVFRVTTDGTFSVVYAFPGFDPCGCKANLGGAYPNSLFWGADGAFYGTTHSGGANSYGSFFKLTADGVYTDLFDFSTLSPRILAQGGDGNFYGAAGVVGVAGGAPIFKLTPEGTYSVIHLLGSTQASEGAWVGAMVYGADGNLYVATLTNEGDPNGNGAILRVGQNGSTTILHSFSPIITSLFWQGIFYGGWVREAMNLNAEGAGPMSLIQTADGALITALLEQGPDSGGAVASMTPDGVFNVLHTYGYNTPEANPSPTLVADGGDGSILVASHGNSIFKLQPTAPVSVIASFSPSTVSLGQRTTLSWSSTGAVSCKISGDYVDTLSNITATSSSHAVTTYSKQTRKPAEFFAVVNCVTADGKTMANATATLTVQ